MRYENQIHFIPIDRGSPAGIMRHAESRLFHGPETGYRGAGLESAGNPGTSRRQDLDIGQQQRSLADGPFNLPIISRQIGTRSGTSNNQGISGYTINKDGDIDFPVLGHIHVAGMTREEIASYIKKELISKNLVKDPVVTVEFMNLTVSVLGEVANPGRFNIDKDKLTLLDALSMAGDLTVYGKRENVLVQREENGKKTLYQVNLNSGYDLYASPVYYLQQNDIVYV